MLSPMLSRPVLACLALSLAAAPSCTLDRAPGVSGIFVAPASLDELTAEHYLDHPWPSDVRRAADGTALIDGLYNPTQNVIVSAYLGVTKGLLDGFSPTSAAYFRFDGEIDTSSLPATPPDALSPEATLQLVDVDPGSPEAGSRRLLEWHWQRDAGVYWLPDTLAVIPAHGYPLRPHTRYALVMTRGVKGADGVAIRPSDDLAEILGIRGKSAKTAAVSAVFEPAISSLASAGVPRESIAQLTVFTTTDPTDALFRITDHVHAHVPAPTADPTMWKAVDQTVDYDAYQGWYGPVPNYQTGKVADGFAQLGDGGQFTFDENGQPVVQSTFSMRFTLVVPKATKCPPPADGYPITLYAHGTGGDYRSIIEEGHSVGQALAQQCVASMGVDQIFHGARPGAPPATDPNREGEIELLFFNLNNPVAARTNGQEGAVDVVQQARLFSDSHTFVPAMAGGAPLSRTGSDIHFDPKRLLFFGHSQGGVNGPLYLAADASARGGVLSGTGAMITVALLEKTQPTPSVAGAVRALLGLASSEDASELNLFHPVINLAQMIVDATDPVNYMPFIIKHPRPGMSPKSIYQTEGIAADGTGDNFAPPHGIEYASVAMGLPRELPGVRTIAPAIWGGIADVTVPPDGLSGNLASGQASGVLGQFPPAQNSDGHFVVFDVPAARLQAAQFCKNLAADARGRVPAIP